MPSDAIRSARSPAAPGKHQAIGEQVSQPIMLSRAQTERAIEAAQAPPAEHPYSRYIANLRSELSARGLPTSAQGVRVFIASEPLDPAIESQVAKMELLEVSKHAATLGQIVSGSIGLARGAMTDVQFQASKNVRREVHSSKDLPLREIGASGVRMLLHSLDDRMADLRQLASLKPAKSSSSVAVWSNGLPLVVAARWVTSDLFASIRSNGWASAGDESPLAKSLAEKLGHSLRPSDQDAVFQIIAETMAAAAKASPELVRAQRRLEAEVAAARQKGLVIFKSAGNDQNLTRAFGLDARGHDFVKGVMVVGAIDLGQDPTTVEDDTLWEYSVEGATLGVVGVKVPLMGRDTSGTSNAAAFMGSVAALMISANPAITPQKIEEILKAFSVAVRGSTLRRPRKTKRGTRVAE